MKLLVNVTLSVTSGSNSPTYFHKSNVTAAEILLYRFDEADKTYAIDKLKPFIKESLDKLIDEASAYAPKQLTLPGVV